MKVIRNILSATALLSLMIAPIACDGEKSDPATESRGDLNPPTGLVTLTGDGQITLRWQGNNTEDGFKGYDVFAVKGSVDDLAGHVKYPATKTAAEMNKASLPRCLDNTKLFEAFGFPATDTACEGETAAEEPAADALMLTSQDEEAESDGEESLAAIVKCDGKDSTNVSLPAATEDILGPQECVVKALADGTALANGTTYTFFVASVLGDDFSKISWTSNFVTDAPANQIFSGDLSFESGKVLYLPIAKLQDAAGAVALAKESNMPLTAVAELAATDFEAKDCTAVGVCSISDSNTEAEGGIYMGRLGADSSRPIRIFLSVPAEGEINVANRGAQTYDPLSTTAVSATIPGDMAADGDVEGAYDKGNLITVNGNQVVDFAIVSGGNTNYGKMVFAAKQVDATDVTAAITMNVTVFIQEADNVRYYLK